MEYGKYNALNILHYLIVPKADHPITQCFQIFRSILIIFFLFQMLTAIQFKDELGFGTAKVGDVIPNRVLSAERDSQLVVSNS